MRETEQQYENIGTKSENKIFRNKIENNLVLFLLDSALSSVILRAKGRRDTKIKRDIINTSLSDKIDHSMNL